MSNLFAAGASLIADVFQSHGSQSATYTRHNADGTSHTVTVYVTLARNPMQVSGDVAQGSLYDVTEQDFLIRAADLILNSQTVEPREGDRITTTIGGQSRTFKVAFAGSDQAYSHDPFRKQYRVRTKRIT
jgi:hypothetical protein